MNSKMWKFSIIFFIIASTNAEQCGLISGGAIVQQLNKFPVSSTAGLFYDEEAHLLYSVDQDKPALCTVCDKDGEFSCVPIPGVKRVTSALPIKKEKNKMVALTDHSLLKLTLTKDPKGKITQIDTQVMLKVVQDASYAITASKADSKGRLLIDVGNLDTKSGGKILQADSSIATLISNLKLPLGMDFSSNGKKLFQVDAIENVVWEYCYDQKTGQIDGKPKVVFNLTQEPALTGCLCSVATTKSNDLWIGVCETGIILNYNPDKKIYNQIQEVPTLHPISLEMGGKQNDVLFVGTEASKGDTPAGGGLFAVSGTGTKGVCSSKVSCQLVSS